MSWTCHEIGHKSSECPKAHVRLVDQEEEDLMQTTEMQSYLDDRTGAGLNADLVKAAREEEITF